MTDLKKHLLMTGCGLALLAFNGCRRAPEGWNPVMEESSTAFLTTETEAVASHLRLVQTDLTADPVHAAEELAAAQDGLDRLLDYYLPLLEARELAYNAYRHHYLGKTKQTSRELDDVEMILMTIAKSRHGHLLPEMEDPLEKLEDARAALEASDDRAAEALRELATRLNFLLVRGDLVLSE